MAVVEAKRTSRNLATVGWFIHAAKTIDNNKNPSDRFFNPVFAFEDDRARGGKLYWRRTLTRVLPDF
jgi:hypothetical protein